MWARRSRVIGPSPWCSPGRRRSRWGRRAHRCPPPAARPAALRQRSLRVRDHNPANPIRPERQRQPGELPAQPGVPERLGHEELELLASRGLRAGQLQLQAGERCGRRRPLDPGEEEPLDRLDIRGRFREARLHDELAGRARPREREVQLQAQPTARGGEAGGECRREPTKNEADRLQLPDRWVDGEGEPEPFRGAARPERVRLLAARADSDPEAWNRAAHAHLHRDHTLYTPWREPRLGPGC
ncbi:MAG: hypothetical protein C0498_05285 [Anaerolinea sp.]|nr:hypothetical protein [Anaerolinea sp.]